MVIGLQIRKLHGGGGGGAESPALLDSEKPGLCRVNTNFNSCSDKKLKKR